MKKQLLLGITLGVCFGVSAQQNHTTVTGQLVPKIKPAVANKAVVFNPYASTETPSPAAAPVHPAHPHTTAGNQAKAYTSTVMGSTIYDLQTNASMGRTLVLNADGTMSAVFNLSTAATASGGTPDRGTGYNYFNGTTWGANPTARLESVRTGWPSVAVTGTGGELTITHLADGASHDLVMMSRPVKGTGTWTQTSTGIADTWPRMVVGGPTGQTVHVIAESQGAAPTNPPYMGMISALTYSRSLDGGLTWDINRSVIPQIDASHYYHFNGDDYNIDVQGSNVAIVAGGLDNDVVLLKSSDNGTTWTKTIVKQFPIPMFDATTMISDTMPTDGVADTLVTNDGSVQVLLDDNGMAHVWYGNMRMINDAPSSTGAVSYFPGTDGLMYWNESMGSNPPVMIAAAQDLDGNGQLDVTAFGTYYVSLTSMPSASIDAAGKIYLSYASVYEGLSDDGTVGGGKSYRHTFVMSSPDHGATWCTPLDITDPFAADYVEGVFGSLSRNTDSNLHLIFQRDASPGHGLSGTPAGSTDPQNGPSDIVYVQMPTSDITCLSTGIATNNSSLNSLSVYPNPASNNANLEFSVAHKGNVVIKVYNVTGQMVAQLTNQDYAAGKFNISLNLEKYKAGIYMINMTTAEGTSTQKLIVQ